MVCACSERIQGNMNNMRVTVTFKCMARSWKKEEKKKLLSSIRGQLSPLPGIRITGWDSRRSHLISSAVAEPWKLERKGSERTLNKHRTRFTVSKGTADLEFSLQVGCCVKYRLVTYQQVFDSYNYVGWKAKIKVLVVRACFVINNKHLCSPWVLCCKDTGSIPVGSTRMTPQRFPSLSAMPPWRWGFQHKCRVWLGQDGRVPTTGTLNVSLESPGWA